MPDPATLVTSAIIQVLIRGPQILEALNAGTMTVEEAEAAWDLTVQAPWRTAADDWRNTPDGSDAT